MSVETSSGINLATYAEKYPHSAALDVLATADPEQTPDGWWDLVVNDYHAGTLPLDGAVAANYSVMHPMQDDPARQEQCCENARRLVKGQTFAIHTPGPVKNGLVSRYSGVLASNAVALFGWPSEYQGPDDEKDYPQVDFGIPLDNRKDILRVAPYYPHYLIGDEEIAAYYKELVLAATRYDAATLYPISEDKHFVESAAVVRKLGIEVDDTDVKRFEEKLVTKLFDVIHPSNFDGTTRPIPYHGSPEQAPEMLVHLAALNLEMAQQRIEDFNNSEHFMGFDHLRKLVSRAVAQIRSNVELDSVPEYELNLRVATAEADLIQSAPWVKPTPVTSPFDPEAGTHRFACYRIL